MGINFTGVSKASIKTRCGNVFSLCAAQRGSGLSWKPLRRFMSLEPTFSNENKNELVRNWIGFVLLHNIYVFSLLEMLLIELNVSTECFLDYFVQQN